MSFKFLIIGPCLKNFIRLFIVLLALLISEQLTFNYVNKLSFDTQSTSSQSIQLFFSSNSKEYSPKNSKWVGVPSGYKRHEITYPFFEISKIRFDLESNKNISIGKIHLNGIFGDVDCSLDNTVVNQLSAKNEASIISLYANQGELDPYISFPCQDFSFSWKNLITSAITFFSIFFALLFLFNALHFLVLKYALVDVKKNINIVLNFFNLRPYATLLAVSILGVTIASSQTIFFGQSFVSPLGTSLIYSDNPSLPGFKFERIYDYHGSDTGATMWQHIPYTFLAGDAIRNHELPLWNRFNGGGRSLIGQGQAMVAEPINLIIASTGFTSIKYDFKYIFLKLFFGFSTGILVYLLTGQIVASSLIGFLSIFVSFFLFRLNHPGYFTLAYSPLVLMSYLIYIKSEKIPTVVMGSLILLISNWLLLTSGTGKEAYLALLIYNFIGCIYFLINEKNKWKLSYLLFTLIIFAVISLPLVATFLDYIVSQKSGYSEPGATQYSPMQFFSFSENVGFSFNGGYQPGLNFPLFFLFTLGLIFLFTRPIFRGFNRFIFFSSSLFCLSISFGLMPAEIIKKVPFLNSVHHVNDVFSSLAVPIVILCSGLVLVDILDKGLSLREKKYFLFLTGLLILLAFSYNNFYFNSKIFIYLAYSLISIYLFFKFLDLLFLLKSEQPFNLKQCAFLVFILAFFIFRNIQWPHTDGGISKFVFVPSPRANLKPEMPTLEKWKEGNLNSPYRGIGIAGTMFSGYRGIYGVESLDGPDALFPKYYRVLSEALQLPYGWYWRLEFNNENIQKFKNSLNFLNVGYIFAEKSIGANELPILDGDGLLVYRRNGAWPRAFFTSCPIFVEDDGVLQKVMTAVEGGAQNFVVLPKSSSSVWRGKNQSKNCKVNRVTPATDYILTSNNTSFHVSAPSSGFVYLGENFEEGNFIAKANGVTKDIVRSNYAFKGIFLDNPGEYNISFEYTPKYFFESLKFAVIAAIIYLLVIPCLLIYYFLLNRRHRITKPH